MKKSYWLSVTVQTDRQRQAVLSWFSGMCDGMTVESAAVLCDNETDREKKIKVIAVDKDGKRYRAERTKGGKTHTITLTPLHAENPQKMEDPNSYIGSSREILKCAGRSR